MIFEALSNLPTTLQGSDSNPFELLSLSELPVETPALQEMPNLLLILGITLGICLLVLIGMLFLMLYLLRNQRKTPAVIQPLTPQERLQQARHYLQAHQMKPFYSTLVHLVESLDEPESLTEELVDRLFHLKKRAEAIRFAGFVPEVSLAEMDLNATQDLVLAIDQKFQNTTEVENV